MWCYLGLVFDEGNQNCFTLMRQYLFDTYGIDDIPNYACPTDWHLFENYNFLSGLAKINGFYLLEDDADWCDGDVLLMALQSPHGVANHCAVIVEDGKQILHHLTGRLSELSDIRGFWRRATLAVYRHKKIPQQRSNTQMIGDLTHVLG